MPETSIGTGPTAPAGRERRESLMRSMLSDIAELSSSSVLSSSYGTSFGPSRLGSSSGGRRLSSDITVAEPSPPSLHVSSSEGSFGLSGLESPRGRARVGGAGPGPGRPGAPVGGALPRGTDRARAPPAGSTGASGRPGRRGSGGVRPGGALPRGRATRERGGGSTTPRGGCSTRRSGTATRRTARIPTSSRCTVEQQGRRGRRGDVPPARRGSPLARRLGDLHEREERRERGVPAAGPVEEVGHARRAQGPAGGGTRRPHGDPRLSDRGEGRADPPPGEAVGPRRGERDGSGRRQGGARTNGAGRRKRGAQTGRTGAREQTARYCAEGAESTELPPGVRQTVSVVGSPQDGLSAAWSHALWAGLRLPRTRGTLVERRGFDLPCVGASGACAEGTSALCLCLVWTAAACLLFSGAGGTAAGENPNLYLSTWAATGLSWWTAADAAASAPSYGGRRSDGKGGAASRSMSGADGLRRGIGRNLVLLAGSSAALLASSAQLLSGPACSDPDDADGGTLCFEGRDVRGPRRVLLPRGRRGPHVVRPPRPAPPGRGTLAPPGRPGRLPPPPSPRVRPPPRRRRGRGRRRPPRGPVPRPRRPARVRRGRRDARPGGGGGVGRGGDEPVPDGVDVPRVERGAGPGTPVAVRRRRGRRARGRGEGDEGEEGAEGSEGAGRLEAQLAEPRVRRDGAHGRRDVRHVRGRAAGGSGGGRTAGSAPEGEVRGRARAAAVRRGVPPHAVRGVERREPREP
ncbi:hypothetical protein THAOC_09287, partial [Thalassiosira oceanica]